MTEARRITLYDGADEMTVDVPPMLDHIPLPARMANADYAAILCKRAQRAAADPNLSAPMTHLRVRDFREQHAKKRRVAP